MNQEFNALNDAQKEKQRVVVAKARTCSGRSGSFVEQASDNSWLDVWQNEEGRVHWDVIKGSFHARGAVDPGVSL
jgi:hypothetical protein